jgi:cytochrome c biogenesis protein CcmG/thiol:disulfide interchange protein DsbE
LLRRKEIGSNAIVRCNLGKSDSVSRKGRAHKTTASRSKISLSKKLPVFLGVLVVLAVATGAVYFTRGGKQDSRENPKDVTKEVPKEGHPAPQFSLQDLGGRQVGLSDFRGKVVLLNFWATWCAPCRREIPSLERLYRMRKDEGFEIVAVNTERASASKVASFVGEYGMSFPILLNPQGDVGSRYRVRAIPTSFLLDKNGVIRWQIVGGREWESSYVLDRIDRLLAE